MAVALPDLPNEMKLRILEFAATIDTSTCLAVCLTDKKLGLGAGRKELYRDIKIAGKDSDGAHRTRQKRWASLCHTLLKNRALAAQVKSLAAYLDNMDHFEGMRPFGTEDEGLLSELVSHELSVLTPAQRDSMLMCLSGGSRYGDNYDYLGPQLLDGLSAYLGTFIIACPKLRLLSLEGCPHALLIPNYLSQVLRGRSHLGKVGKQRLATGFESIQEFSWAGWSLNPTHFGPVLRNWPVLQKVTASNLDFAYLEKKKSPSLGFSSLQELYMRDCDENFDEHLAELLKYCPEIKILSLVWTRRPPRLGGHSWRKFAKDLQKHNPSLRELRLDVPDRIYDEQELHLTLSTWGKPSSEMNDLLDINEEGLGNLEGLRNLRKFAARKTALFGIFDNPELRDRDWTLGEILPWSVEEVEVFCGGVEFTAHDLALLCAPGTEHVHDITIFNVTRDKWISKRLGEGSKVLV